MIGLEMNNLLNTCLEEFLKTNPSIELKGKTNEIPAFLINKNFKFVEEYSYNSLKIRTKDWAIIPYDTDTKKYIIGWIENDSVIANNVPIAIAVWFNMPQLGCAENCAICYDYCKSEKLELDPMIYTEENYND